ncbi:MAG: Ig-like domain-containing protein, partial [Bacteroidales bacterium]|nr:Ig-like domain-containing protein [Bacteroidales bacterium]
MKTNVLNMLNAGILFCLLGCLSGCDDYRRVNEPTQEITVNSKSLNLFVGETRQLTASPTGNAFDWSSDDPDVVTVNSDGLVTAVSEGFSTIVVASGNSAEVSIDVRVRVRIPLTDIHLPSSSLKLVVGSSVQLDVNAVPDDASDVTFTWRSENPDIAIVDNAGTV